jgi:hypothetical protein
VTLSRDETGTECGRTKRFFNEHGAEECQTCGFVARTRNLLEVVDDSMPRERRTKWGNQDMQALRQDKEDCMKLYQTPQKDSVYIVPTGSRSRPRTRGTVLLPTNGAVFASRPTIISTSLLDTFSFTSGDSRSAIARGSRLSRRTSARGCGPSRNY